MLVQWQRRWRIPVNVDVEKFILKKKIKQSIISSFVQIDSRMNGTNDTVFPLSNRVDLFFVLCLNPILCCVGRLQSYSSIGYD